MPTTSSTERSTHRPTRTSGPTPRRCSRWASWFARAFSSRSEAPSPRKQRLRLRASAPPEPRSGDAASCRLEMGRPTGPIAEYPCALAVRQERELQDVRRRVCGDGSEQREQVPDHAVGGVRIEQIRAELQGTPEARLALLEVQHELEAGRAHRDVERARRRDPADRPSQGIVEKGQHGLEDRRARQISLRNDVLDQLLERDVLMRVRLDSALSDTTQHLIERRDCPRGRPAAAACSRRSRSALRPRAGCGSRSGTRRRCRPVRCAARAERETRP